jgi:hypothetical protein
LHCHKEAVSYQLSAISHQLSADLAGCEKLDWIPSSASALYGHNTFSNRNARATRMG